MKYCATISNVVLAGAILLLGGCALFPETRLRDTLHNPFPQLSRVAVLPFFNQSSEPTVDADQVAESYYAALQAIPGFEVLPVGVTKRQWMGYVMQHGEPRTGADFQQLAQFLNVDAVVVGSVTDFDAYYPPRFGLAVNWYAANPGFHPIPAGYGLPWGTDAEDKVPRRIVRQAEFELARSQLRTQTPVVPDPSAAPTSANLALEAIQRTSAEGLPDDGGGEEALPLPAPDDGAASAEGGAAPPGSSGNADARRIAHRDTSIGPAALPADWPDPTDLIPDPPSPQRPIGQVSYEPILSHTRLYRGDDAYVTGRLADYVETGDDARPSGWQGYLSRSDDFVRFCCHLHVSEMLESRGGRDESDLILKWSLSRY